jgi:hypothetical protein
MLLLFIMDRKGAHRSFVALNLLLGVRAHEGARTQLVELFSLTIDDIGAVALFLIFVF